MIKTVSIKDSDSLLNAIEKELKKQGKSAAEVSKNIGKGEQYIRHMISTQQKEMLFSNAVKTFKEFGYSCLFLPKENRPDATIYLINF